MKATIEELTVNRRYYCTYDKENQDTFWGLYIASMALSKKLNNTLIVMKHKTHSAGNNSYYTLDNSDTLNYIHYMSLKSIQTLNDLTYNQLRLPDDIIHYIALFV